jgi:hypothetical protein
MKNSEKVGVSSAVRLKEAFPLKASFSRTARDLVNLKIRFFCPIDLDADQNERLFYI